MDNVDRLQLRPVAGGVIVPVKAVPGSWRDKVAGVLGGFLKITTAAAAEKGKANAAIAKTLARTLAVPPQDVKLIAGRSNPHKEFHVAGLSAEQCRRRLEEA